MTGMIVKPENLTERKTIEIEDTGEVSALYSTAYRLKASEYPDKVLIVPTNYTKRAMKICKDIGVNVTVRNLTGSFRKQVY